MNVSNIMNVKKVFAVGLLSMGLAVAPAGAALADHDSGIATYEARLTQLNRSGVSGNVYAKVVGDQATVRLVTEGASENLPHAQHFHIGGNSRCPDPSADTDGDGFISSVEGLPSYGPVKVSLTETGDSSASSGLALDRFPVASSNGTVTYERTFTLPDGVTAADVANGVVVQHGISDLFDDENEYDGDKRSTLDENVAFEATVPSTCGDLQPDRAERQRERARDQQTRQDEREDRREEREQAKEERQNEREQAREERKNEREQRRLDRQNANGTNADASINTTGPGSDNSITINSNSEATITNRNDVGIDLMIEQDAQSGDATSSRNTEVGDSSTGDADNSSDIGVGVSIENSVHSH